MLSRDGGRRVKWLHNYQMRKENEILLEISFASIKRLFESVEKQDCRQVQRERKWLNFTRQKEMGNYFSRL